jgi:hypothetical protein
MQCNICGNKSESIFQATILDKYAVDYYYCNECNFLQTEHPYWLEEAYENKLVNYDTGTISRNIVLARKTAVILYFLFDSKANYLDFAGGYGILTRMMRDIGFNFYWSDLYTPNIFAKGFEYNDSLNIQLLTAFESFEHFVDPLNEIDNLLSIADNILFTTELLPAQVPKAQAWWYYALAGGQHISFYSYKTLKYIAQKYKMNIVSGKHNIHLLTKHDVSDAKFNLILRLSDLLYYYVRKRMKSKTADDFKISADQYTQIVRK